MPLSVEFSEADAKLLRDFAAYNNVNVLDFVRQAVLKRIEDEKDARNAAYLAKISRGFRQAEQGSGTAKTWNELEELLDE